MNLTVDRRYKVPVIKRAEYTVYLEQANADLALGHIEITRWNPTVRAMVLADWELLKSLRAEPIHALHDPADKKHEKFLTLLGMTYAAEYEEDGEITHIYKS